MPKRRCVGPLPLSEQPGAILISDPANMTAEQIERCRVVLNIEPLVRQPAQLAQQCIAAEEAEVEQHSTLRNP